MEGRSYESVEFGDKALKEGIGVVVRCWRWSRRISKNKISNKYKLDKEKEQENKDNKYSRKWNGEH